MRKVWQKLYIQFCWQFSSHCSSERIIAKMSIICASYINISAMVFEAHGIIKCSLIIHNYYMRIIFLERHARIGTYSILGYASPRPLQKSTFGTKYARPVFCLGDQQSNDFNANNNNVFHCSPVQYALVLNPVASDYTFLY